MTNLDHGKMLHLAKGEIVGFAHEEEVEMNYTETTNVLEMGGIEEKAPQKLDTRENMEKYSNRSEILPQHIEVTEVKENRVKTGKISPDPREIPRGNNEQDIMSEISCKKTIQNRLCRQI